MQENQTDVNLDGSHAADDDVQKDPGVEQVSSAQERELSAIESESADPIDPQATAPVQQVDAHGYVAESQQKSHKGLVIGAVLAIVVLAAGAAFVLLPR